MLSGAAGQIYGSKYTWQLENGWETNLDSPGVIQLRLMKDLFAERKWYDLFPDQTHTVVTAGYGEIASYVGKVAGHFGNLPGLTGRPSRFSKCSRALVR